jgi:hypothetical protein
MTTQEKYERLKELVQQRKDLDQVITNLENEIGNEISPYKVGDIVPNKSYAYRGKDSRVQRVRLYIDQYNKTDMTVFVDVLTKDKKSVLSKQDWRLWNDDNLKVVLSTLK